MTDTLAHLLERAQEALMDYHTTCANDEDQGQIRRCIAQMQTVRWMILEQLADAETGDSSKPASADEIIHQLKSPE